MTTATSKRVCETEAARRERGTQEENAVHEHGREEALDVWSSQLMTLLEQAIVSIDSELDATDRELEETTRRAELRKTALSKLTKEEREELGV